MDRSRCTISAACGYSKNDMASVKEIVLPPLERRVCLTCGYRGAELQREGSAAAFVCPRCGQDLYTRPARSYAEMEGLSIAGREVMDPAAGMSEIEAGASTPKRRGGVVGMVRGWILRVVKAVRGGRA